MEPKKPAGARKGKGKGFGAQKVNTDFSEIENRAQRLDKEREELEKNSAIQEAKTQEEKEKQMASMRLAYQDMSIQRKKEEEKLKASDPKKAEQLERLGMGFGGSKGISHSAISDMQTIQQDAPEDRVLNLTDMKVDRQDREISMMMILNQKAFHLDLQNMIILTVQKKIHSVVGAVVISLVVGTLIDLNPNKASPSPSLSKMMMTSQVEVEKLTTTAVQLLHQRMSRKSSEMLNLYHQINILATPGIPILRQNKIWPNMRAVQVYQVPIFLVANLILVNLHQTIAVGLIYKT